MMAPASSAIACSACDCCVVATPSALTMLKSTPASVNASVEVAAVVGLPSRRCRAVRRGPRCSARSLPRSRMFRSDRCPRRRHHRNQRRRRRARRRPRSSEAREVFAPSLQNVDHWPSISPPSRDRARDGTGRDPEYGRGQRQNVTTVRIIRFRERWQRRAVTRRAPALFQSGPPRTRTAAWPTTRRQAGTVVATGSVELGRAAQLLLVVLPTTLVRRGSGEIAPT